MTRAAITLTEVPRNTPTAAVTTAINATDGMSLDVGSHTGNVVLIVTNTFAGAKILTVKAGDNPPAFRAGLGDLAESFAQNAVKILTLESARFIQDDGKIHIDAAADMTGTIQAYRLKD
jgi:hypothetical protein